MHGGMHGAYCGVIAAGSGDGMKPTRVSSTDAPFGYLEGDERERFTAMKDGDLPGKEN